MQKQPTATPLHDLGVLRFTGPDAVRFLQGQLSNDVTKLSAEHPLFAGLHNPQGRVVALLRLLWLAPEDILAVLPRELATTVAERLGKYILRAKVKIKDESASWRVTGIVGRPPVGSRYILIDAPRRGWLIAPIDQPWDLSGYSTLDREGWRALDIATGLPQVYATTSEKFVAQMLNLDALGAIAFDKGCYTGQEIIARAHYRGQVKRRLQRLHSNEPSALAPGSSGQLPDGRGFEVVEAARSTVGWDFLAVVMSLAK